MLKSLRKIAISSFFVLHISALIFWVFPPYSDMVLSEKSVHQSIRKFEQNIFSWFKDSQNHTIPRILNAYIDFIGAHQYWDFFAPEAPTFHRYIRVCPEIIVSPGDNHIVCIDPLYKSYDGNLLQIAQSFGRTRSRSFRLTENLIRFQREDLFESFTRYWLNENAINNGIQNSQIFLVLTEYPLHPHGPAPNPQHDRKDSVVWITQ